MLSPLAVAILIGEIKRSHPRHTGAFLTAAEVVFVIEKGGLAEHFPDSYNEHKYRVVDGDCTPRWFFFPILKGTELDKLVNG